MIRYLRLAVFLVARAFVALGIVLAGIAYLI